MKGKDILVIGALAGAAYLLLGGSGAEGGVSGGGGKKATVETGFLVPQAPQPINPPVYTPPQYQQPVYQQPEFPRPPIDIGGTKLYPMSSGRRDALWSRDDSVSSILNTSKKQDAIVYTSPQQNDSRMVDYYVEIGGPTGINPTTTKKESSSSSQNYSSQGGGTYSNSGFGGWG